MKTTSDCLDRADVCWTRYIGWARAAANRESNSGFRRGTMVECRFGAAAKLFNGRALGTLMAQSPEQITGLLQAWRDGNRNALDELVPIVYNELRRIAHRYLRRQPAGQTLQTTAVVHEAYLRLTGQDSVAWQNRAHFYGVCAQVMRSLLVDRARARNAVKRGGHGYKVSDVDGIAASTDRDLDIVALDEALERLASIDPRKARIVELRYFGGLTVEEAASFLDLSPITIKREWLKAKAWLYSELHTEHPDDA